MGPIEDLGKAINGIAEGAGRSTVGIGNRWRGGSGVVVEAGKVLTNAHNLHGDEIRVFFADGREADGKVLGADGDGDLAVIGVDTGEAPAIDWGDGTALAIGAPVVAIGNPAGQGVRVTLGFVSGLGRVFRGPRGRRVVGRGGAHRSPAARLVRRADRRRRRQAAGHQHQPAGQRLLPGHRRRRRR